MIKLRPLIPLTAGVKAPPLTSAWSTLTSDELRKVMLDNADKSPNVGLRLDNYLALDPDDEVAVDLLQRLEDDGLLPPTLTWETWRGHPVRLYMARTDRPTTVQWKKGIHLEMRTGKGAYCVVPPSIVKGKAYKFVRKQEPSILPTMAMEELARRIERITSKVQDPPESKIRVDKDGNPHIPSVSFSEGSRDMDIYTMSLSLFMQGWSYSNVLHSALTIARGCVPPFPEREVKARVDSAMKMSEGKAALPVGTMVRDWIEREAGDGIFTNREIMHELGFPLEPNLIKRVNKALRDVCAEGQAVRVGNKRGYYRAIQGTFEKIDFLSIDATPLPIKWPLGLHKVVDMYERSIAVFAGEFNSGKTAVLMDFIRLNFQAEAWNKKIRVLFSEGSRQELRKRLELMQKHFEIPLEAWLSVEWGRRDDNFADCLHPDKVNVIDYLDRTDDFWKIAEDLKLIHQKLDKGMAVVAVQKKRGERLGRGADFGAAAPRLYCSISKEDKTGYRVLSVEKGKHNRNSDIYDLDGGYKITFRIRDGVKLEKIHDPHGGDL